MSQYYGNKPSFVERNSSLRAGCCIRRYMILHAYYAWFVAPHFLRGCGFYSSCFYANRLPRGRARNCTIIMHAGVKAPCIFIIGCKPASCRIELILPVVSVVMDRAHSRRLHILLRARGWQSIKLRSCNSINRSWV